MLQFYSQRATSGKELGAARTWLRARERGTRHVYLAGPAAAAPTNRNAAPPGSHASKASLSLGTDVNERGASGSCRGRA